MNTRPDFESIKDFEEFSKYYWYREELIKICKKLGLKADGGKIELNKVIETYFSGEKILPLKKNEVRVPIEKKRKIASKKKATVSELSLDTGLIECGFTFGPRFRDFFIKQTGEVNFKFNVDMVATAKAVKESGDEAFKLGDLLDIYFCRDDATKVFPERLKAAAALWKIVRESDREKKYSHALLEEFRKEIEK